MYRLELEFDTNALSADMLKEVCLRADQIFAEEDLNCADREPGRRVYLDRGRKQDYGRFWAAIFALKNSSVITRNLKECVWYNGTERENLITDFLQN